MVKLVEIAHGYEMNPARKECSAALLSRETFFLALFNMND